MSGNPAISIVMPVYNSEGLVEDAILSILVQDFEDFELILIDDGSRDSSGAICDRYATLDRRIRVIHQENAGMCAARNLGLSLARGEFVTFCDNDDLYLPGLLSTAFEATRSDQGPVDCVCYGRVRILIDADGRELSYDEAKPSKSLVIEGHTSKSLQLWLSMAQGVWCRLYRNSTIIENGLEFDTRLVNGAEDAHFNLDIFPYLGRIAFVPETLYAWLQRRSGSSSLHFTESRQLGIATYLGKLHDALVEAGVNTTDSARYKRALLNSFRTETGMLTYLTSTSYKEKRKIYRFFAEMYSPYMEELRALPGDTLTMMALETVSHGFYFPLYAATHIAVPLYHLKQRILGDAR